MTEEGRGGKGRDLPERAGKGGDLRERKGGVRASVTSSNQVSEPGGGSDIFVHDSTVPS